MPGCMEGASNAARGLRAPARRGAAAADAGVPRQKLFVCRERQIFGEEGNYLCFHSCRNSIRMISVVNLKSMFNAIIAENLVHVPGSLEHYIFTFIHNDILVTDVKSNCTIFL